MRTLTLLALASVSASLVYACSSSSSNNAGGTDAGSQDGTTSSAATFTQVYTGIISQKCSPCHTTPDGIGVSGGQLDMTSQAAAYANLVNKAAAGEQCNGKGTRVVPGKPDSSVFYLKVSLDDPSPCGSKMPLGRAALAQSDVDMIDAWITAGATNDGTSATGTDAGQTTTDASTATDSSTTTTDSGNTGTDGSTGVDAGCKGPGEVCGSNAVCCSHSCDLGSYMCN